MEISRKMDYALRLLAEVTRAGDDAVVSVRVASELNDVPYSFARSIQHDLVRAGILTTIRGPRGGMALAVDPHVVTLRDVLESMQGPIRVSTCEYASKEGGPCPFMAECHFNPIWCEAERLLEEYLDSVTLYQVVVENLAPGVRDGFHFEAIPAKELASAAEKRA